MPKIIPIIQEQHYKQEVTTVCRLIKIIRKDGVIIAITNLDRDLILTDEPFVTYKSNASFDEFAISTSVKMNVDNVDFRGQISHPLITVEDLRTGRYDDAEVLVGDINYMGELTHEFLDIKAYGLIGNVQLVSKLEYSAEIRGQLQYAQQTQSVVCQPGCRAKFGDARCRGPNRGSLPALDIEADFTFTANITSVTNQLIFKVPFTQENDYYKYGEVHFLSGKNKGMVYEIKEWNLATQTMTLEIAADFLIEAGDSVKAICGCNKTVERCANYFSNAINFQGEPHVPLKQDAINYMS